MGSCIALKQKICSSPKANISTILLKIENVLIIPNLLSLWERCFVFEKLATTLDKINHIFCRQGIKNA